MVRFGIVIDLMRCVGCHTCTLVCRQENLTTSDKYWNIVLEFQSHKNKRTIYIPYFCMQCREPPCAPVGKEPACVRNCPSKARLFGDIDNPESVIGKDVKSRKAIPLPSETKRPMAFYTGPLPNDVLTQLPKASRIIPRKNRPIFS